MAVFRQVAKHFGVGLVTVLPFALVIWVLAVVFNWVDGLFGPLLAQWTGVHVPGVGFVLVVLGVTFVGAMTQSYLSRQVILRFDALFQKIPLVKSLYSMFKEMVQSLIGRRRGFARAVLVPWPDERAYVIGLVTHETLPPEIDPSGEMVSVYLPGTFQFAGTTVLIRRNKLVPCGLSAEDAFKFAISAGLGRAQVPGDA